MEIMRSEMKLARILLVIDSVVVIGRSVAPGTTKGRNLKERCGEGPIKM